jgi:hypothetical protein
MSFEQMLSVSSSCDLAEAHSRRAEVRSCKAPILGTELDRLSGIVYLVLDGHIKKKNITYMC